jgi:hypothetical protein
LIYDTFLLQLLLALEASHRERVNGGGGKWFTAGDNINRTLKIGFTKFQIRDENNPELTTLTQLVEPFCLKRVMS